MEDLNTTKNEILVRVYLLMLTNKLNNLNFKNLATTLERSRASLYYHFESQSIFLKDLVNYILKIYELDFRNKYIESTMNLVNLLSNKTKIRELNNYIKLFNFETISNILFMNIKSKLKLSAASSTYLRLKINYILTLIRLLNTLDSPLKHEEIKTLLIKRRFR